MIYCAQSKVKWGGGGGPYSGYEPHILSLSIIVSELLKFIDILDILHLKNNTQKPGLWRSFDTLSLSLSLSLCVCVCVCVCNRKGPRLF